AMRAVAVLATAAFAVTLAGACARADDTPGQPVETRPPNAEGQQPAFPGQTRAPGVRTERTLRAQVIASGLEHPWALAQLPDGRWLVTERPGRLRVIGSDGTLGAPIEG